MIQDWGYNYIYLCHAHATTCIDLKDHSYKDVAHTPVRDMISTAEPEDSVPSWIVNGRPLWLSAAVEEGKEEGDVSLEDYIPEPFPKHEFEPHGWQDILATLDVCADVHATKHCDEEGYDLISMNMVNVVFMEMTAEASQQTPKKRIHEVYQWVPKQKNQSKATSSYKWIPKKAQTSTKAQSQPSSQGQCRQRQYNISRGEKKSTATRWIPKNMVHHIDHYWAWVPKSILHPEQTSTIATNKTAQQRWFKQGRPRTNNTQGHPDVLHQNKQKWIPKDQRKEMKKQVAKQVWHSKLNQGNTQ